MASSSSSTASAFAMIHSLIFTSPSHSLSQASLSGVLYAHGYPKWNGPAAVLSLPHERVQAYAFPLPDVCLLRMLHKGLHNPSLSHYKYSTHCCRLSFEIHAKHQRSILWWFDIFSEQRSRIHHPKQKRPKAPGAHRRH